MGVASEWELWLERRKKNIGYITRTDAFAEPTEAQKTAALKIEAKNWDETRTSWADQRPGMTCDGRMRTFCGPATKGKTTFTIGEEYSIPLGHGINLLRTREPDGRLDGPEYTSAFNAYIVTPMDPHGILKAQGIDVSRYEKKPTIFHKLLWKLQDWWNRKNEDYGPNRTRLTKEFIDSMTFKEKK
jgi:hypothetical protein